MQKTLLFVVGLILISGVAWAGTYVYTPTPADLYDLNHPNCYSWTIDLSSKGFDPTKENILSATVNFHQINDWTAETDKLFITLMDPISSVAVGVATYTDISTSQVNDWTLKDTSNSWKLKPTLFTTRLEVGSYSDNDGHYGDAAPYSDVPIGFSAASITTLNAYAADKLIAIGFDPDCHYYNSGIDLTITTGAKQQEPPTVPEPMSVILGAMGLASIGGLRRLRK